MKFNLIKKVVALVLIAAITLVGCTQAPAPTKTPAPAAPAPAPAPAAPATKTFKIGISQLVQHPALDQARAGFEDELKALGVKFQVDYANAQAETANTQMIAEKFVKDKVDLIYTIATLSTQAAKKATQGSTLPVVFSSVTDPVYSQIVAAHDKVENVTGVTDKVEASEILKLAKDLKPSTKVIGIIYNTGESNSEVQIQEVKAAAKDLGMSVETVGLTSVNDIPQAINTLAKKIDIMYIISDNMVSSAIQLVANKCLENKIITLSSIESLAAEGILIGNGLNYYDLGKQAARMAKKILVDGVDVKTVKVEQPAGLKKVVNVKTMQALGLSKDNKAFAGAEFIGQ